MKSERTTEPDKISLFRDQDEVMKRLLEGSRNELEKLQSEREILVIKNTQLADELTKKQSRFDQWKRGEEQKMEQEKIALHNEIIKKDKQNEIAELDMHRRLQEIAHREELGKVVIEKEAKLNNDRIEIEKLRSSASLLMDNAERKMSEASSVESQSNIKLAKAKEIETKANALNESIIKRENIVADKEKELQLATKNLEELKLIVEPKIKEIKEREDRLEKNKKELLEKELDVDRKINEEKIMLKQLESLQKTLKNREKELDQKDDEITRKALRAEINVTKQ